MAITRKCDLCSKGEDEVGFIQHYDCIPKRRIGDAMFLARGVRSVDLCAECVSELTIPHEAARTEDGPTRHAYVGQPAAAEPEVVADPVARTPPLKRSVKRMISGKALPAGTIAVMTDKGIRYPYTQKRPNRCTSCFKRSGTRCYMDTGHAGQHRASNGQHWDEIDGVEYVPVDRRKKRSA